MSSSIRAPETLEFGKMQSAAIFRIGLVGKNTSLTSQWDLSIKGFILGLTIFPKYFQYSKLKKSKFGKRRDCVLILS